MENAICEADIKAKKFPILPTVFFFLSVIFLIWCIKQFAGIYDSGLYIVTVIGAAVLIFSIICIIAPARISQKCSLALYDDKVDGQRKTFFSMKTLKLPIEKVDNIMVSESFIDKIWGGKTVAVRSASGVIKFPWVRNADEFVAVTLAMIEEYKESAAVKEAPAQVVQNIQQTSAADELAKFKKLLDDGVITQEDFEAKKKQLLGL